MKIVAIAIAFFLFVVLNSFVVKKEKQVASKEELGEVLFFDKILSSDKTVSCASCHKPEFAFADTLALSNGVGNGKTKRNTPTAMNMASRSLFFFDGRAATLEEQALGPIQNPDEMNLNIDSAVARLRNSTFYSTAFKKIYKQLPCKENLCDAIASFEKTLETSESDYDAYVKGNKSNFSESALRGKEIFIGKGKCFDCHSGVDFTNDEFRNIGLFNNQNLNDKGRFDITKNDKDLGAFKVVGLRNVAATAPYMHNGMFKTLNEVVAYYNEPNKVVPNSVNRDTSVQNLKLSKEEEYDLVEFMKSLTDKRFKKK